MPTYLSRRGTCLHTLPTWAPLVSLTLSSVPRLPIHAAPSALSFLFLETYKKSLSFLLTLELCFLHQIGSCLKTEALNMGSKEQLVSRGISQFLTLLWHLTCTH